MLSPSFYQTVDWTHRESLYQAYLDFMTLRNGVFDEKADRFPKRARMLSELDASPIRYEGEIDAEVFRRLYSRFRKEPELTTTMLVVLAFVRLNAGEAYGVRVTSRVREARRVDTPDIATQIEREVGREEEIHTRLLVGAASHFGLEVAGAYRPPLPLKMLIHTLAYSPKVLFHPILFASEVMGIYTFNWMLTQLPGLLGDQPELLEILERRLIEVLIDEVGHVSFNRLAVGPMGLRLGKALVPIVVDGVPRMTPEMGVLGFNRSVKRDIQNFDFGQLPQEVRERSFIA